MRIFATFGEMMRLAGIGLAAFLLLIAAIVIIRTAMFSTAAPEQVSTPLPSIDASMIAQHLGAAVRFKTISYAGGMQAVEKNAALDALRNWIAKTYPNLQQSAKREIVGKSLLYTWQGQDPALEPILLMAHMDVVPVVPGTERSWVHGPFSGDVAEGYVWGRGAVDDKASLVAILEAGEQLARSGFAPTRTIMFAFGQDEEVGGEQGNGVIAATLAKRGVRFFFVLDEGGAILDEPFAGVEQPAAFVAVEEKGYLSLELVAHGEGGHSSRPTHDLAIVRLADAIEKVVNHPFASGLDSVQKQKLEALAPYVPWPQRILLANLWISEPIVDSLIELTPDGAARLHTTIAPTIILGGVKDNVLPPEARATINFRLHPRDTIESVITHVRKALDDPKVDVIALRETMNNASKISDIHGAAYRYLSSEIRKSFGDIPVAPDMTTTATDSAHYQPIADAVFRLDPFHFGSDDLARIHGTNERLAVRNLAPAVGFYMHLMEDAK